MPGTIVGRFLVGADLSSRRQAYRHIEVDAGGRRRRRRASAARRGTGDVA